MIDEQTTAGFESLLIATLAEMIPKAHQASADLLSLRAEDEPGWTTKSLEEGDLPHSPADVPMQAGPDRGGANKHPRRLALIGSALVAAAGIAAFAVVQTRDTDPAASPTSQPAQADPPGTIVVPSVEDENSAVPFDGVAIAPGTVGWFELGDLPTDLAARVGNIQTYTNDYASVFFRCVTWTEAGRSITCTKLAGGNYVQLSSFGPAPTVGASNGLGTQLGDGLDAAQVLWAVAQGSLWGYDSVTTPPTPTRVAIGPITGLSYRNGDSAYLAWERSPGVIVWLAATGYTDTEMAQLAASVRPAALSSLPLLVDIGAKVRDLNGMERSIHLATVKGVRCAGITLFTECTRLDQGAALVRTLDGSAPVVGAVAIAGPKESLVVTLGNGEQRVVALADAGLGLQTALYTPATGETMVSARISDATGATLRTMDLTSGQSPTTTISVLSPPTT